MKFKIGDKVIHNVYGTGVVKNIANRCSMPYEVEFDYKKRWCEECNLLSSTLTTGQMIDALKENPKAKYEFTSPETGTHFIASVDYAGILKLKSLLKSDSAHGNLYVDAKWTLVSEPKPGTFMDAVKSYREGKTIYCLLKDNKWTYNKADEDGDTMCEMLAKETDAGLGADEILFGAWFVEG